MNEYELDQVRVAKLVIVGWIKDWTCATLYQAITSKQNIDMDEVNNFCEKYKFLPSDWFWYFSGKGLAKRSVRKYMFDLNKKLNNALWDTEDNLKRLEYAKYLVKLTSNNIKASSKYTKEDMNKHKTDRRKFIADELTRGAYKEYLQKVNNTHWSMIK